MAFIGLSVNCGVPGRAAGGRRRNSTSGAVLRFPGAWRAAGGELSARLGGPRRPFAILIVPRSPPDGGWLRSDGPCPLPKQVFAFHVEAETYLLRVPGAETATRASLGPNCRKRIQAQRPGTRRQGPTQTMRRIATAAAAPRAS